MDPQKEVNDFNAKLEHLTLDDDFHFKFAFDSAGYMGDNLQPLFMYSSTIASEQGYLPWKLVYDGIISSADGGSHQFYFICEDRRI